jgi:MFS family permease
VLLIAAVGLFGGITGGALTTFTVDAAIATGLSQTAAGALLAAGSIAAVAGGLAAGWLADRRGSSGLAELAVLTGLGTLSLFVVSVAGDARWLFVVGVLAAFATGWGWPGIIYFATVQTQRTSRATGIVLAWVYAGNVIGPTGAGLLIAHLSYPAAWRMGAISLGLATLAALVAGRAL